MPSLQDNLHFVLAGGDGELLFLLKVSVSWSASISKNSLILLLLLTMDLVGDPLVNGTYRVEHEDCKSS